MLEAAETGQKLSKEEYAQLAEPLRIALLRAQQRLREADFAVIITLVGDDRPGVNEVANLLHTWLDPRGIETHAFAEPTDEERERPAMWRFWQALPADGRIALVLRLGMMPDIADHAAGKSSRKELNRTLERYNEFERTLVDDGALRLKFWLHLPPREFKKRLRDGRKDGRAALLDKHDLRTYRRYADGIAVIDHALEKTNTPCAPWHVVESADRQYRDITVAAILLEALQHRLEAGSPPLVLPDVETLREESVPHTARPLDAVDLSRTIDKDDYDEELLRLQSRVHRLADEARDKGVAGVLAFEGWDAAGKGGCIRRLVSAMDAENYRVVPIAAPTDEEKAHHYLWRFWRHVPRAGFATVYDRSWYGRVLVERVEGFAKEEEWRRAFREINEFEEQLVDFGMVVCKFWLHLSKEEQLRRFEERERTEFKRYKITPDDWRNREKWEHYEIAVNEMIDLTSTKKAPWTIVSANDQRWARLEVLRTFQKQLAKKL